MSTKRILTLFSVLLAALLIVTPASACYTAVQGELRDSATNNLWQYGAQVYVYNCNTLATLLPGGEEYVDVPAAPEAGYGTFNTPLVNPGASVPLCVEVIFEDGPSGTPGNTSKTFADRLTSTGTLNAGVFFTGTGPTVVSMSRVQASPVLPPRSVLVFGLGAMVAGLLAGAALFAGLKRLRG